LLRILVLLPFVAWSTAFSQVNFTSSNLPIVVIDTDGQWIPDEGKINVFMGIVWDESGARNYYPSTFNHFGGTVGIEVRGSSSQMFPKKSFGVEIRNVFGEDDDFPLLGMPAESDWVLYAPYTDKSMLRDVMTMNIARELGWYASRTKFCELVLNGVYQGVYVLMEKVKRDGGRVNIKKMDADDLAGDSLTGGYIIKIDKWTGGASDGWASPFPPFPGAWQQVYYQYHYPAYDDIAQEQKNYIQDYVYQFENVMYNNSGNPDDYLEFIEDNSFIDFMIINEIGKNVDGYRLSTFLYKDRESEGGKLTMGPIWDFNLAFGNADYYQGWLTSGWQYAWQDGGDSFANPFYWSKLMQKTGFYNKVLLRWNELRQTLLSKDSINAYIDLQAELLDESQQRNYVKWPILGQYVWPNAFVGQTYDEELDYLKTWTSTRIDWIDSQLKLTPVINEINYNVSASFDAGEWVEIYNPNLVSYDISNWRLKDANNTPYFAIPNGTTLPPQGYLVICANTTKFHSKFPNITNYIGNLPFDLSNTGEPVRLTNSSNSLIDYVYYSNTTPWPPQPNGTGPTLELKKFTLDNNAAANWRASATTGGTPGLPNSPVTKPDVFVNEFMADNVSFMTDPQGDFDDWIEIYNGTSEPFNIGGLYITDDLNNPTKYLMPDTKPDSTTIPAGGFLLLWADSDMEDGVLHIGFKLSKSGEQIGLYDKDGFIVDFVTFGGQNTNQSSGRITDGYANWQFFTQPTPGYSNNSAHTIQIPAGWSGISSYRQPFDPNIENMFEDFTDELLFLGDRSNFYIPDHTGNTLQTWDNHSGYMIKSSQPFALQFTGPPETNHVIQLQAGWNLIPVLSSCDVLCSDCFSALGDVFEIATDVAGWKVYWPEKEINSLEVLNPGKSYYVKVSQAIRLTIKGCP